MTHPKHAATTVATYPKVPMTWAQMVADLIPATYRRWLYVLIGLVPLVYGAWLASGGDWTVFVLGLLTSLTGGLSAALVADPADVATLDDPTVASTLEEEAN